MQSCELAGVFVVRVRVCNRNAQMTWSIDDNFNDFGFNCDLRL